ncbi:hypothetical protein D9758_017485 [Tetrapyrgos nigripes]|uniref:Carboxylic ester hydrolase n=1 Tax=Tetrapyrgos nigripes TaxID=182062 RepID=A0A8H5FFB3_9AGAR|nr:hypothetical protein D9758_017485 [Tetrapyrgos nigripes]
MTLAHLLLIYAISISTSVFASDPSVSIGEVTFVGRQTSENVEFFGGVPFAEPPIGNLRLRPPILTDFTSAQHTVINVTQFGPSCVQAGIPTISQVSEDCLGLSIFRPAHLGLDEGKGDGLPVMVWLYGGGFLVGSSSMYDGTPLVNRSVFRNTPTIFVAANYRLGPLGFPRGDDVGREADAGSRILNLGLQDNIAALQWVKQHIASFGGDPSKVTVFGESAGARAIEFLLLSGKIQGLARGAIMESTGGIAVISPTSSTANTVWDDFMTALPQCTNTSMTDVECIRHLNTSELIEGFINGRLFFNSSGTNWFPTLDDDIIPGFPSTLKPDHDVLEAVIIGCNQDESTLVTDQSVNSTQLIRDMILESPPSPPNASPSQRKSQLQRLRHILEETLALYPNIPSLGSPFNTGNETFGLDPEYKRTAAVATDLEQQAERRFHINHQLIPAGISTFSYVFTDPDAVPVQEFVTGTPVPGSLGVTHSSEIFYVFGTLAERPEVKQVTPTAAKLSDMMMDYWISFANTLNPNDGKGSTRPNWPEYIGNRQEMMQLNGHNTTTIKDDFRERQIALFNRDPAVFAH